jgi:hypothetical protein
MSNDLPAVLSEQRNAGFSGSRARLRASSVASPLGRLM